MNRTDKDPTEIKLQTNVKKEKDPTLVIEEGIATHGMTPFKVAFISQIEGNLWQGGVQTGLELPHFFKHIISVYPWEAYQVKHNLDSSMAVMMYDSLDQSMEQVDAIANWINVCVKSGPTLVHCQAGLNRSSLVAGRALMLQGYTADEAINLLRTKRSTACLCNPAFEQHLRSLDTFRYYACKDCHSLIPKDSLKEGSCPDCGSNNLKGTN